MIQNFSVAPNQTFDVARFEVIRKMRAAAHFKLLYN